MVRIFLIVYTLNMKSKDVIDVIKERFANPLYGTYLISVILWNWKFFYILFLQSEDKLIVPKIEYIQFVLDRYEFWQHISSFIIFPSISTFIIIKYLPYLINEVEKVSLIFFYKKESIRDTKRLEYESEKTNNLKLISKKKEEQKDLNTEIDKNTSIKEKQEIWSQEYLKYKEKNSLILFKIKETIYNNNGAIIKYNNRTRDYERIIDSEELASADLNGLVEINGSDNNQSINLTPKGKFFLLRLTNTS